MNSIIAYAPILIVAPAFLVSHANLNDFIAQLALDSINVQLLWNQAHVSETETLRFPRVTEPWKLELFRGLVPGRLSHARFEMSATVLIRVSQEQRFSIGVVPLNLLYARRYATDIEKCSRITLTVEQSPMKFDGR
jgi:hypothetical protein